MVNTQNQISSVYSGSPRFEELFRLHHQKCLAYAKRMSGNWEDAEDLAQDAFYRAYRSFDHYDHKRPFDRWVFRIISNLFIDRMRARSRAPQVSLDAPMPGKESASLADELPDSRQDPAVSLMSEIMDEKLEGALVKLSDSFRRTIFLVDVHELSYEEAAQRLDCSVGTIRSRVHRARKQLRTMLAT